MKRYSVRWMNRMQERFQGWLLLEKAKIESARSRDPYNHVGYHA